MFIYCRNDYVAEKLITLVLINCISCITLNIGVRLPSEAGMFLFATAFIPAMGAHSAYQMYTGGSLPGGKAAGA
jgi:hypothetical protein